MTLLKERPEIRQVPTLERPRRPWFGWIVSLLVLVVAGGIWLVARDTGEGALDGSFAANEQARFERIGASAIEANPTLDGFDLAELQRFDRIRVLAVEPALAVDGFDQAETARFARIGAVAGEVRDGFEYAEFMRFMRLEP